MPATEVESLVQATKKTSKSITVDVSCRVTGGYLGSFIEAITKTTRHRYERHGIDLSKGYPERPLSDQIPLYVDDAIKIRDTAHEYLARGKNADKEKKALFSKVKEVKHLTKYIGTELVGVQLAELNEQDLDELALLIAERVVVFFRDQDLSPQKQLEIGDFFGKAEVHPQVPHVPGLPGSTVIWNELARNKGLSISFKNAKAGTGSWHSSLPMNCIHQVLLICTTKLSHRSVVIPCGHLVMLPMISCLQIYNLQQFLEGKFAYQKSLHTYLDRANPLRVAYIS
jgi:hypothetical protein